MSQNVVIISNVILIEIMIDSWDKIIISELKIVFFLSQ